MNVCTLDWEVLTGHADKGVPSLPYGQLWAVTPSAVIGGRVLFVFCASKLTRLKDESQNHRREAIPKGSLSQCHVLPQAQLESTKKPSVLQAYILGTPIASGYYDPVFGPSFCKNAVARFMPTANWTAT